MANIQISELQPAGVKLFQDDESFMNELSEQDMDIYDGGGHGGFHNYTVATINGNTYNANSNGNVNTVG